ncbi:MAG: phosphoribosylformylglycinamidine synthase subunit PurL [Planctomycetes bacterium]|nr:phosphoribosylformylglycinamidine synthase subunit PurL [Planctomycetota bacterium]
MIWRFDVRARPGVDDSAGRRAAAALRDAGLAGAREVAAVRIYLVEADWDDATARRAGAGLFIDPVLEDFTLGRAEEPPRVPPDAGVLLVFKKPGVMDPVEESALKAAADLGFPTRRVRTGTRFEVRGRFEPGALRALAGKALANEAVDEVSLGERSFESIALGHPYRFRLLGYDFLNAGDDDLAEIGRKLGLSLTAKELRRIQEHFRGAGRNPTDVELETLAQTWSEHCKHKTFTGDIVYGGELVQNLLKSTIMKATRDLARPWCVSVFKDNAGIIEFDDKHNVCFKVETHNHPSAIDPYGGANTGLGGVIRDVLGCGLGARPVCSTDVFCVGSPDAAEDAVPPGVIHPRRILSGVVAGVRDYGNRMGIPTVNGAVLCDPRYVANPLVFCGTVGILPKGKSVKEVMAGDAIVLVGGRTGRDGIHGATFSSAELHDKSEEVSGGAVQIGNAIMEKRVLDTILQARDRDLFTSITDCGAGGLSSAVGEMGANTGAEVDLEKVPLKYEGLTYSEIWISEAQERMVLAVPPARVAELLKLFASENVEATAIGRFTDDGDLHLRYEGKSVGNLDMEFLHEGLPRWSRTASYSPKPGREPLLPEKKGYGADLHAILSSWNVCSKEWIVRQYDHEVQGGSVIKPLVGAGNDGPGDAAVVRPVLRHYKGLAIGCGINPRYSDLSAYDMAACAIDEAVRNVVAVGGDPARTALLDNFCWGSPEDPENLGALLHAARACHDMALAYGTPFISGKDSLNNEFRVGDRRIVIPHTLLISALSIVEDVRRCTTMDAKGVGDLIYVVGTTKNELGGSHYYLLHGELGANVPKVDAVRGRRLFEAMASAVRAGVVRACHDLSEGGLATAAAEMAFAGDLGIGLELARVPCSIEVDRDDQVLFSESATRFLVEVREKDADRFERMLAGVACAAVGEVLHDKRLVVKGRSGKVVVDEKIADLHESWKKPMRW